MEYSVVHGRGRQKNCSRRQSVVIIKANAPMTTAEITKHPGVEFT
jgi:hypothetical protein